MDFLAQTQMDLKKIIRAELNLPAADLDFTPAPQPELGDFSLPLFGLGKILQTNPADLAAKLARNLALKKIPVLKAARATGPYLNFKLQPEIMALTVLKEIKKTKKNYGRNQTGRRAKVMIEYSNANTHKEYHIGHLRNIAYGEAVYRLLMANGYTAIPVSYINDFGIHVAKTIWYYANFYEPQHKKIKITGQILGECYAAAVKTLNEQPELTPNIKTIMKAIESRRGRYYKLWQITHRASLKYFAQIYRELGVKFKTTFYENKVINQGLAIVKKLQAQKILVASQGAIIADLKSYNLNVLPIIRSDGTALYPVADLALAELKFKRYQMTESLYVIDVRQSLYFQQLLKLLELMGYKYKTRHLSYEFVTLPEGMMSSRTGNIITFYELLAKTEAKIQAEIKTRRLGWSQRKITTTAHDLALAVLKFEMLKVAADKIITFDWQTALKMDGYTAIYIEYGLARLNSILHKAGSSEKILLNSTTAQLLTQPLENKLILKLAQYPAAVAQAGLNYNPSEIAKYLFELTQIFNDYYQKVPILKAAVTVKRARLALLVAIGQVLTNGLNLLGIKGLREI